MNQEEYKNAKKRLRSLKAIANITDDRQIVETKIRNLKKQIRNYEKLPGKKLSIILEKQQLDEVEPILTTAFAIYAAIVNFLGPVLTAAMHVASGAGQVAFWTYGRKNRRLLAEFLKKEFLKRGWKADDKVEEHVIQLIEEIKSGKLELPESLKGFKGYIVHIFLSKRVNAVTFGAPKKFAAYRATSAISKGKYTNYKNGLPSNQKQRDLLMGYIDYMRKQDSQYDDSAIEFELGLKSMYVRRLEQDYTGKKARQIPKLTSAEINSFREDNEMPPLKENRERPIWDIPLSRQELHELKINFGRFSPAKTIQDFYAGVQELFGGRLANRLKLFLMRLKQAEQEVRKRYGGTSDEIQEVVQAIAARNKVLDYHKLVLSSYKKWRSSGTNTDTVAGAFAFLLSTEFEGETRVRYTYDQIMKMSFAPTKGFFKLVGVTGRDDPDQYTLGDMLKTPEGAKKFLDEVIGLKELRDMIKTEELIEDTINMVDVAIRRLKSEKKPQPAQQQQPQQQPQQQQLQPAQQQQPQQQPQAVPQQQQARQNDSEDLPQFSPDDND